MQWHILHPSYIERMVRRPVQRIELADVRVEMLSAWPGSERFPSTSGWLLKHSMGICVRSPNSVASFFDIFA
jgi:hypothetical protein